MKLIKPSFEIISLDPEPLKHIERVARTCYKSEDKITDESAPKFVKMLYDKGHHAMLEFYPFYFKCNPGFAYRLMVMNQSAEINGDLMVYNSPTEPWTQISCNLRTAMMLSKYSGQISGAITMLYPELKFMFDKIVNTPHLENLACNTVDADKINLDLQYATVKFITDRGVTHELVRHRKCSFAQESTRYVNYGGKDMEFIIPSHFYIQYSTNAVSHDYLVWMDNVEAAERDYNVLLEDGQLPQQARAILPNCLKTEIVVQARLSEWKHIFKLRCDKTAHPDMRAIMILLRDEMNKLYNGYFNDNNN